MGRWRRFKRHGPDVLWWQVHHPAQRPLRRVRRAAVQRGLRLPDELLAARAGTMPQDPEEPCEVGDEPSTCRHARWMRRIPMGIDPIWHYTANKITFFNSFKMKISIIVGVIQMSVGICLSLLNHIEYKDYKRIAFEYIPEMIFFEGIFGYLVFCIFWKWSVDWNGDVGVPGNPGPQPAPSILTLLINMFMSPTSDITVPLYGAQCFVDCGAANAAGACGIAVIQTACPSTCLGESELDTLTPGSPAGPPEYKVCFSTMQQSVQFSLLIAAFISVPFLLIPIPFIELYEHNQAMAAKAQYDPLIEEKAHAADDAAAVMTAMVGRTSLAMRSSTRRYIRSSLYWAPSPTPHPTYASGHYR